MKKKLIKIAIDGPVGAGKSTVAKMVADKLQILYIDTGAMYRAVALYMQREGIKFEDEQAVVKRLDEVKIELSIPKEEDNDGRKVTTLLNKEDVSWEIRQPLMGEGASVVSQYALVREKLVSLQQKMALGKSVIMEGRDIATKVLPSAELKIYLDANPEERARRKVEQASSQGITITLSEATADVNTRDNREKARKIDPLRADPDAWILDTTKLSIAEVVEKIVKRCREIQ